MRLYTDDEVHRFQGRWIDARGSVLPFQARYVAWGLFILAFAVGYPILLAVGIGYLWGAIYATALSVLAVMTISDKIDGERPVKSWLAMLAGEWRCLRYRRGERPGRATRTSTRKVRGLR